MRADLDYGLECYVSGRSLDALRRFYIASGATAFFAVIMPLRIYWSVFAKDRLYAPMAFALHDITGLPYWQALPLLAAVLVLLEYVALVAIPQRRLAQANAVTPATMRALRRRYRASIGFARDVERFRGMSLEMVQAIREHEAAQGANGCTN
jgi:hypothetical protein